MGVKGKELKRPRAASKQKHGDGKLFQERNQRGNMPREKDPRCQNKSTRVKRERGVAVRFPFSIRERCSLWFLPSPSLSTRHRNRHIDRVNYTDTEVRT
jgi:hypothetical protein